MPETNYWTEPTIKIGKVSFVWFRYVDVQRNETKLIIRKGGVNRKIFSRAEKRKILEALRKALLYKLQEERWNPITNTSDSAAGFEDEISGLKRMTLSEALNWAYAEKLNDWTGKSRQDFKSTRKYLLETAKVLGLYSRLVVELRRGHYLELLNKTVQKRHLGAKGFNRYRSHLSSLLAKLEEFEVLEYNPVEKIRVKDTITTNANRPPTPDEKAKIVEHIRENNYHYYRFLCVLYGTTLRPLEIQGLQIRDLDFERHCFSLTPEEQKFGEAAIERKTKTKFYREVIIPDWVFSLLAELKLQALSPDWYIFAKDFLPGPKRIGRNASTRTWRGLVKVSPKKGGLGLDVNQYGLKKLAGDDLVKLQMEKGVNDLLRLPQIQMGHASSDMTETYVSAHTAIINKVIREYMPEL